MRSIDTIFIHCSATPNGKAVSTEAIRAEHKRKWRDIGYHRVIEVDGSRHQGREFEVVGAGVEGHNARSIHVCMVGGLEGGKAFMRATRAAWDALRLEVTELAAKYARAAIKGHRDASPDLDHDGVIEPHEWIKACPAFDVAQWRANGMAPLDAWVLP